MKVQLKKEIEERSNDSALKDEYNRKLGDISAQLNEMKVQQQQERKDKKEWKEQQERKRNENLKDGKYEMCDCSDNKFYAYDNGREASNPAVHSGRF